jgi:hypothetical protein
MDRPAQPAKQPHWPNQKLKDLRKDLNIFYY